MEKEKSDQQEEKQENNRPLTKDWFIREVADRARFTIGDTVYFWNAVEEILKDIIYYEEELVISGLFKLYVATIPEHEGYNPVEGKPMLVPESKRIVFRASRRLLGLFEDNEENEDLAEGG
jgi:nucleoid DNA-binding protein